MSLSCSDTLGACCALEASTPTCFDGDTSDLCSLRGGTWFPRLHCVDEQLHHCRRGQCCTALPDNTRKRSESKRSTCKRQVDGVCPCDDVSCPAGDDAALPCSRVGVCEKVHGLWGVFSSSYQCRFGTEVGDVCAQDPASIGECLPTNLDAGCTCDACLCSVSNVGQKAEPCGVPTTGAPTTAGPTTSAGQTTPSGTTAATTAAPTCPPAVSQCVPGVLDSQCTTNEFDLFTPYPAGTSQTDCLSTQPCAEACCASPGLAVTARVVHAGDGTSTIEYYFSGTAPAEIALSGGAACAGVHNYKCKFIAGAGSVFEADDRRSDFESSSSSSESSIGDDASVYSSDSASTPSGCTVTQAACGLTITLAAGYSGVALFVGHTDIDYTGSLSIVTGVECASCGLVVPVPACSETSVQDAIAAPVRVQDAASAMRLSTPGAVCTEPAMPTLFSSADEQASDTAAWADLADERLSALLDCAREPFYNASSSVALHKPTDGVCDYGRCFARIGTDRMRRDLLTTALTAVLDGDRAAALQHYIDAAQDYCCAEYLADALSDAWSCTQAASRCGTTVVHPRASPARGRPSSVGALELPQSANGRPLLAVLAFEQCLVDARTPDDNDVNDGVFEVSATSHVTNSTWLDYTVLVRPLAFGTADDGALDVRLAAIGVPAGSRVYVSNVGTEPHTVCYTANSVAAETADCPSVAVVRLFRSLRAAFPTALKSAAPQINTLLNMPHVATTHLALLVVYPPAGTHASLAQSVRLDFELAYTDSNGASCTVRSDGLDPVGSGFAVLVPSPFRWPLENVPAYIEMNGICTGGDDAGEPCTEAQQCAHGYCQTAPNMPGQWRCIDAPLQGVNAQTSCSHESQCAYGTCYGYAGSGQLGAYPLLERWLECVGVGCYTVTGARTPWCAQSVCLTDALNWDGAPAVAAAADSLYPSQQ
jgi:hypothetical protein